MRDHLGAFVEAAFAIDFEPRSPKLDEAARAHKVSPERLRFAARKLGKPFAKKADGHDPILAPWRAFAALPADEFEAKAAELVEDCRASPTREADRPGRPGGLRGRPAKSLAEVAQRYGELFEQAAKAATTPTPPSAADPAICSSADSACSRPRRRASTASSTGPSARSSRQSRRRSPSSTSPTPARPPRAMVLNDSPNPTNPHVFVRGNPGRPGKPIPRRFLRVLSPGGEAKPFAEGSGRLELAKAIVNPENPLTARVMVNRIWHHHFGVGLVATPSDFGARGEPPTHPELLDYLARRFIESGWSVKAMHRLILLSSTYQQISDRRDDAFAVDPANRLLWRQNRRRLDFESIRDGVLAVSGSSTRRWAAGRSNFSAQVAVEPPDDLRDSQPLRPRRDLPDLRLPQPGHQHPDAADHHRPAAGPLPDEQPVPARPGQGPRRTAPTSRRSTGPKPGSTGSISTSSAEPRARRGRGRSPVPRSRAEAREARRARPVGGICPGLAA